MIIIKHVIIIITVAELHGLRNYSVGRIVICGSIFIRESQNMLNKHFINFDIVIVNTLY